MEQTIIADALDNLRVHQRQLDMDGTEVGVSRQALNEAISYIGRLTADRDFWKERLQVETRARIEAEALSRTGAVKVLPRPDAVSMTCGTICLEYEDRDRRDAAYDWLENHAYAPLSALEPAAPEGHKAASAASVDPDGIWERAYAETAGVQPDDETNQGKEGFCYRDENGKVQFQQTAPAANETRRGKSRGEPHKHGPNDEPGSLAAEQSGETGPGASGGQEPVAWRCKDYADGWVVYGEKSAADRHQRNDGCLMQPLYTHPAEQAVTEEMVARASAEYQEIFGRYLLSSHARRILKAAMEAGCHD